MTYTSTASCIGKSISLLYLFAILCSSFHFGAGIAHGQASNTNDSKLVDQEDVRLEKDGYHPEKIQQLAQSTKLKRLRIVGANISDEELQLIGRIAQLELLDLSGCQLITDKGISYLANLSKLKNLSLGSPSITDASLETICQLPALAALTLQGCTIDGPGLIHLGKLTRLKEFGLINSMVGDMALDALSPGEVVKLKMRASGVTQAGLRANLPRFPKLKSIDLGENNIDDTAIPFLAATMIEDLNLLRTLITSNGVSLLSELPLIRLNLDDIKGIDDSVIPHILKMKRLEFLHLGKTKLTDKGLSQLKDVKSLKDLIINNTAVSESALLELQRMRPELRIKR